MARIMVFDDHPLVLAGIRAALLDTPFKVVATASDGAGALEQISACEADAVILDVRMPKRSGLDVLRALRLRGDTRPVVLLTASIDDARLLEAFELGAQGILSKESPAESLPVCLQHVMLGGQWIEVSFLQRALALAKHKPMTGGDCATMTPRQRTMAELVAKGLRNRDIAVELGITEGTVKVTIHRLYDKLGLHNRVELALFMRHNPVAAGAFRTMPTASPAETIADGAARLAIPAE